VKSGDNGTFFLDAEEAARIPRRFVARCVRGRDLAGGRVTGTTCMLWPPRGGWDRIPRWLEKFAAARGVSPDDLRLDYVRSEHLGIKVVWKDVGRGLTPAVLGSDLIPNQTLYLLAANSLEEARAIANVLGSTIFNALAIMTAERAKDFHYRYFARTIARVPLPLDVLGRDVREAYGVTRDEEQRLASFLARRLGRVDD
jgi:hypothetical protein